MAKVHVWDYLTPTQLRTLTILQASGKEVFAARIEIKHRDQLKTIGISWSQCQAQYIGPERIIVHLTPADEQTYRYLLNELRTKHHNAYRERRCRIPGKCPGTPVRCPECNKCAECPHPECQGVHVPETVSLDVMLECSCKGEGDIRMMNQFQAKPEYENLERMMNRKKPLIPKAFRMKVVDGPSADEIAQDLGIIKRTVYYYLDHAKTIGREYNRES